MFLVRDSREERTNQIHKLMDVDVIIAVIMAAADFEWTCRRCILALGKSPTKYIREKQLKNATFRTYPKAWHTEVYPRLNKRIEDVLSKFTFDNKMNEAFILRNKLVHGEIGSVNTDYGREKVEELLIASTELTAFADKCGEPIYGRRLVRVKPR